MTDDRTYEPPPLERGFEKKKAKMFDDRSSVPYKTDRGSKPSSTRNSMRKGDIEV